MNFRRGTGQEARQMASGKDEGPSGLVKGDKDDIPRGLPSGLNGNLSGGLSSGPGRGATGGGGYSRTKMEAIIQEDAKTDM